MKPAEKKLLLALARGKLGDFQSDKDNLQARRNALSRAIEDGIIDGESPLDRKRPKLAEMDAALVDAGAKIMTLQLLIRDVEEQEIGNGKIKNR